jgi:hypothetical protein
MVTGAVRAEQVDLVAQSNDLLIVALVEKWSYDLPIVADSLQELPGGVYDALRKAAQALSGDLMPDYSPTPDPTAPTAE